MLRTIMRSLSVILPCFNEEQTIGSAVREVYGWMSARGISGEVIVVNDGSTDGSARVLETLASDHPSLMILHHAQNKGYGMTVRDGLDAARSDLIAFMDSDGQFRAESFDLLLPHLETHRFVSGYREHRADPPLRRLYGELLAYCARILFGIRVEDVNCALKVFERSLWTEIRPADNLDKFFNSAMFMNLRRRGIPWKMVEVPHYPRLSGAPRGASLSVILGMPRELGIIIRAGTQR